MICDSSDFNCFASQLLDAWRHVKHHGRQRHITNPMEINVLTSFAMSSAFAPQRAADEHHTTDLSHNTDFISAAASSYNT
jgi:hypothetical protein